MRGKKVTRWLERPLTGALVLACGLARDARADTANDVKGTVGGAMLGAEIVMLTESALRLRPGWMYLVGGAGGALAGGYLGRELSDGSGNRPPSFLLAGGIALIIPTIMGVMTATQYEPIGTVRQERSDEGVDGTDEDDSMEIDLDEVDGASDDGASDDGASDELHLELPRFGLAQAFSRDELATFGVRQVTELHVSLLRGKF